MKIHGIRIMNFPCGDIEIEQKNCDFYVCDSNHEFVIEMEDYPIQKAFYIMAGNCSTHREYLYCVDEDNELFTLYDCFISPLQIPVKQVKVIWNKCLLGYHIANLQAERISSAKYIIKTEKFSANMFVGREDFYVLNSKVHIKTDWHQENGRFNGVSICVELEEALSIFELEKIVLRVLEIYALLLGFFLKVESRKMISESMKTYYFLETFAAYGKTAKTNIRLEYVLYKKDILDFSTIYNNWWNLREKEVVTFNLFSYLTTESSPVRELPIATYIQCFEGYFRIHHADSMIRFSQSAKHSIINEVTKVLSVSDRLKSICEENEIEMKAVIESYKRMSGHINVYSLKEVLEFAIGRSESTQKLFEYERNNFTKDEKKLIDIFIQKATGHRNWLSHLMEQKKRFIGEEIALAEAKLRILFRLTLMHDIGLEVTEESLSNVINRIDNWYDNNMLQ